MSKQEKKKSFNDFLDFVKWMHENYKNHCEANKKKALSYDEYINERFQQLCDEFNDRVIH